MPSPPSRGNASLRRELLELALQGPAVDPESPGSLRHVAPAVGEDPLDVGRGHASRQLGAEGEQALFQTGVDERRVSDQLQESVCEVPDLPRLEPLGTGGGFVDEEQLTADGSKLTDKPGGSREALQSLLKTTDSGPSR